MEKEMGMEEWRERNRKVADILEKYRPEKEYTDKAPKASVPMAVEIKNGKRRCIACGQPLKALFFANHRFCERCRETKNTESDYQSAFQRISHWMSDFYVLSGTYPIELTDSERNICWKSPARMAGVREKKIRCKGFMRRDVIEVNLICAYVQLWIWEKRKEKGNWRKWKKAGGWKRGSIRKIPRWYMAQYLYFTGRTEQADIMRRKWERSKRTEKLFFIDRNGSDERDEYTKMMTKHPLSGLDKGQS